MATTKKKLTRRQLRKGVRLRGGSSHRLSVPPLILLPFINIAMHASMDRPAVVVKKPYTAVPRQPVELESTRRFHGQGTFTCSSKDVEFFTTPTGGTPLAFDGKDNVFSPDDLNGGLSLFAEAKKSGEATLTLELNGPLTTAVSVEAKLVLVELTLEICEPRTSSTTDPTPLPQPPAAKPGAAASDKFYGGRPLAVQDVAIQQERALLIVKRVSPKSFKGTLTLTRIDDRVQLFANESSTKGESPQSPKLLIDAAKIPAKGQRHFVQAAKKSGSFRDTGYRLGLAGGPKEGDIVKVTAVEAELVSNVEEKNLHLVDRVPEKPAPKTKSSSKFMPAPRIVGVKYEVEMRPHLDKVNVKSHKWSTAASNIKLKDTAKQVVKLEATANSSAENDVVVEDLMDTDQGKMKLVQTLTAVTVELAPVTTGDALKHGDDINSIQNPAGCVILGGADASDATKVPIYKITKTTPNLSFTDDDDRIAWRITGGHGDYPGKAKFMNSEPAKRGLVVQVHGTDLGDVLLEPYSGGYGYGMFRAHVVPLHQVKFRVNRILFKGNPTATPPILARAPTATTADAKKHIKVANIYLRQAAIELIPDTSIEVASKTGNNKVGRSSLDPRVVAVTRVDPGFFDVEVDRANLVFGTNGTRAKHGIQINSRNEVVTFAYVHSRNTPNATALATALLCPVNHAPKARKSPPRAYTTASYTLQDKGVPSSSFIPKTGIPGDTPVSPVKMIVLFPDVGWQGSSPATRDTNLLWGMVVATQGMDNFSPTAGDTRHAVYARALAHEAGHVFGLGHRGQLSNAVTDGVAKPTVENLMHPSSQAPTSEDIDIVQVKAIRFSEVLNRTP